MRGRGGSDRDPDPANYNPITEVGDIVTVLDALSVGPAVFIGTSRGGVQVMLLAAMDRARIAGAVLNDVGPRVEAAGLRRIIAGQAMSPDVHPDWESATAAVKAANASQFPDLPKERWLMMARAIMREVDGKPTADHDWRILQGAEQVLEGDLPELWAQFMALDGLPVLAIHGALSDILTARTMADMKARMPAMRAVTVPDRGHVPFLDEPDAVAAIEALLLEADRQCSPTSSPSAPPPIG
jgi:pimeloyl-ACP methyl ester carboxylesterase